MKSIKQQPPWVIRGSPYFTNMLINSVTVAHHGLILCVRAATACPDLLDAYFAQYRSMLVDFGRFWCAGGSRDPQQIIFFSLPGYEQDSCSHSKLVGRARLSLSLSAVLCKGILAALRGREVLIGDSASSHNLMCSNNPCGSEIFSAKIKHEPQRAAMAWQWQPQPG